jgi:hypothetical protein
MQRQRGPEAETESWMEYCFGICRPNGRLGKQGSRSSCWPFESPCTACMLSPFLLCLGYEICRFDGAALERYALYNAVAAIAHLLILTFRDKRDGAGGERGHGFRPDVFYFLPGWLMSFRRARRLISPRSRFMTGVSRM